MLSWLFTSQKNKNKIYVDNTPHDHDKCNCELGHETLLQLGKNNYELYDIVKDIRNNVILTDTQISYIKTLDRCELLRIIKLSIFCNYMLKSQFLSITPPHPSLMVKSSTHDRAKNINSNHEFIFFILHFFIYYNRWIEVYAIRAEYKTIFATFATICNIQCAYIEFQKSFSL